jgi:hypothetical protein
MVEPPFEPGLKETVASALPADAEREIGTSGTVNGTRSDWNARDDVPMAFTARTWTS